MKQMLNLGCGKDYREGWLNADKHLSGDVSFNLDTFPYPLKSDSADHILLDNVLEHLEDPMRVLFECKRILKRGGELVVKVPYYNSGAAYNDIEHKHFFNHVTFKQMFGGQTRGSEHEGLGYSSYRIIELPSLYGRFIPRFIRYHFSETFGNILLGLEVRAIK